MDLSSFMLAAILFIDPMHHHWADEDPTVRLDRISSMASDFAEVCQDPSETPVFDGPDGRIKTCVLLASIAKNESGNFKDSIDKGDERGDGGHSVCIMQINLTGNKNYTEDELLGDRKKCIRAGLHTLRNSSCHKTDIGEMLRSYVSGSCDHYEDEPKKEAAITKTARADAAGFTHFFNSFKKLPKISVILKKPTYGNDPTLIRNMEELPKSARL